ncbi:PREDICTED: sprT-like domain-containing protein Spartan isoform X2 [Chinchilla lanigera]|uniref:sprT-like domain-containing protein Spartan isoform X2 n=1 Tax=Chinchilla lanigera TaxID=34839 RepID=UPI00038EE1CD|nr:PREDICTED: sprT-like domain-containing protein Spartan isoform X2 [Chinchilla lanigera]
MEEDLIVALRLQEEWDARAAKRAARETLSLVDASWELVDPTPDLQALFMQFNDSFFWGRLEAVEVKWSARMTLCAGICCYEGSGGMCSIRVSEPLLKFRPRKDLVETLLHEMIHAYLFITNNDKDREGHGPEFCKHMHRINCLTGANITVYHTFHDEVEEYRRHWWRCNGPCQYRQPYYGYVKRATNRAPSAHDYWWAEHQKTCGGTYIKIKEPENYSKKGKGKTKPQKQPVPTVESKDNPSKGEPQPLIPFSGKGYVLGEVRSPPSSGKSIASHAISESQDLFSQDHSADAVRPDSSPEAKFKQNGSSKKSHLFPPVHQSVLSSYFPRVSVANQKAFRSVSGSLSKNRTVGDITKHSVSSSSQRRVPSSKTPLRNPSKVMASVSVTASQYGNGSKDKFPGKRPRLEDKTTSDTFFVKKEQLQSDGSESDSTSHAAATAPSSSSFCIQSQLVSCPVCQGEVVESQINEHLDQCLEGSAVGVNS